MAKCWWPRLMRVTVSFLKLCPYIAVITNIEREHLDYFAGIDEIREAFLLVC